MNLYQPTISGSLVVSGSVSVIGPFTMSGGSITGTASFASNSGLLSNLDSGSFVGTGSFNTMSSSVSTRVTRIEGNYATTGSNIFTGAQTVCANITSTGTIIAQTLNVQQVTSSVVYSSGSNVFGCALINTQQFTGSVTMTGSLVVTTTAPELTVGATGVTLGNVLTDVHQVTGSLRITGSVCATGNSCFANDVFVYGDLRMQGTDSFIWSPSGASTGYTGFYDAFNNQTSLVVCNSSGHLLLQPQRCNVGVGVANPGQKLEVAGIIHSFDRTNGAVDGAFYASKCAGSTSVIIRSCGNTYFNGGNVGINTDTPITKLQICTTAAAENVLIITNGTQQLQLGVNNGANGSYLFEKNKGLRFGTCDAERLLITDTGIAVFSCQVCAPTFNAVGVSRFFNAIDTSTTGYRYMEIANAGASMYYGVERSTAAGLIYNSDPYSTVWATTNATNLNFGTNLYKRLTIDCTGIAIFTCQVCATQGVRFGNGTTTLNYYEEGSWTPYIDSLTTRPTVSYTSRAGTYTRIGNMVYVFWDLTVSSLSGGSGTGIICNLPFTVSSNMAGYSVAQHRDASLIAASGGTVLKGFANTSTNYIYLQLDYTGACGFCTVPGSSGATTYNSSGRMTGYIIYQV